MHRESGKHLMDGIPKKEKGKQSRLTRQEKVLLAVVIVLAVALVVVVACQSLFVRPNLGNSPSEQSRNACSPGASVTALWISGEMVSSPKAFSNLFRSG